MVISAGTFTVDGGGGASYTQMHAAYNDIAATLTGDLTIRQIGDTTENASTVGFSTDLNGFTLTVENASPHNGALGVGNIINYTLGAAAVLNVTNGTLEVKDIQLKHSSGNIGTAMTFGNVSGGDLTLDIHDIIVDGNGTTDLFQFLINMTGAGINVFLDVNKILVVGINSVSTANPAFRVVTTIGQTFVRNITVDIPGPGLGIIFTNFFIGGANGTPEIFNVISSTGGGTDFTYTGAGDPTLSMDSCASSDATAGGANAITNFVPATEWRSLVSSDPQYLIPKATSQFKEAGAAVSITTDLRGFAFGTNPPIGAYTATASIVNVIWSGSGLASTGANWVGGVAPGADDTATYDTTSVSNCTFDIATAIAGMDIQSGYTGTITQSGTNDLGDFAIADGAYTGSTVAIDMASYTQTGGVFTSTSGVLDLIGDFIKSGGTFTHNSGQVDLTRVTGPQNYDNTSVDVFFKFRIAKVVWDVIIVDQKLQVSDRFIVDNSPISNSPELFGAIELTGTAKLEQNGNLYSSGSGEIAFVGTNHEWIQNNTDSRAQMPAITSNCTDLTLTEGTVGNTFGTTRLVYQAGTITNSPTAHFNNNQQFDHFDFVLFQPLTIGQLTWRMSNFDLNITDLAETGPETLTVNGDVSLTNTGAGSQILFGTLEVKGGYAQEGAFGGLSTGTLTFTGTGAQSVSAGGGNEALLATLVEVNKSSGTLTLLSNIDQSKTGDDFTHTQGTLDLNGFDLSAANDITINDDFADLSGSTISAGGNFSATGAKLEALAPWSLNTTGTNVATNCTIKNCSAVPGGYLSAFTSTDNGGNFDVLFTSVIKFWIGAGAGSASDNTRWSTSSGGGNDTTAPGIGDKAVFDGMGLGACTWDIASVNEIESLVGYTGVQTQSVDVICPVFTIVSNATQEWITSGNDLRVDFLYTETGGASGKGVTQASGTLFWGGDVEQSGTILNQLNGNVVIDGAILDPTGARSHRVNAASINFQANFCTLGQNQDILVNPTAAFGQLTFETGTSATALDTALLRVDDGIVDPDNCTFSGAAVNEFTVELATPNIAPADYGNCELRLDEGGTLSGAYTTTGIIQFGSLVGTQTYNVNGTVLCGDCFIGPPNTALGAIVQQAAGSSLQSTGRMFIRQDNTVVQNNWTRVAGTLDTTIGGDFTVNPDAALNFTGDTSIISVGGDIDFDVTAIVNLGSVVLRTTGSGTNNVTLGGATPFGIEESKSGGQVNYLDAWVATSVFRQRVLGAYVSQFLAAGNYGCSLWDTNRGAAIGRTTRVTVQSSNTGVTQFNMVVGAAGPIARHIDVADSNLTGAIQQASVDSSSDAGNNTIAGAEGWDFILAVITDPAYGYTKMNFGLGLGLGLGLGGGYQYGGTPFSINWLDAEAWVDGDTWED